MKDVLKSAVVMNGEQYVMTFGGILMQLLYVGSLDSLPMVSYLYKC